MIWGLGLGLQCLTLLISAILWQSVLLVEETGVPEENHQPVANHRQTVSHNVVMSTPCLSEIWTYSQH